MPRPPTIHALAIPLGCRLPTKGRCKSPVAEASISISCKTQRYQVRTELEVSSLLAGIHSTRRFLCRLLWQGVEGWEKPSMVLSSCERYKIQCQSARHDVPTSAIVGQQLWG